METRPGTNTVRRERLDRPSSTVWTVGHSTRTFEEFVALLRENRIDILADVRHFPTSKRVPWATKALLESALRERGIGYLHVEDLGGFRKALSDSRNTAWRNRWFRGYADYMASPEFAASSRRLVDLASERRTAVMCAEAVPWKCHRSLLSDSLLARGIRVVHILGPGKVQDHRLTRFAKVRGGTVTYPGAKKGV